MGWSVGYDTTWQRDVGYGVPAKCDYPKCDALIDRGIAYVCGEEPFGGEYGCGLYFCGDHLGTTYQYEDVIVDGEAVDEDEVRRCPHTFTDDAGFAPKPDVPEWIEHKLADPSWQQWRDDNPDEVAKMRAKAATA